MEPLAVATVIAAVLAAGAAVVSAWYAQRAASVARLTAADDLAARFREPLLQAAFNLQTRIYNIVRQSFLDRFRSPDTDAPDRDYAIANTMYLLGQYFCWVEILRRESQFLDPRSHARERELADHLERVRDAFASSELATTQLRIFRGHQRALGELLLDPIESREPGQPRWECLGYAAFFEQVQGERFSTWYGPLRADLESTATDPACAKERLREVQRALLDLVEQLDPEATRTSGRLRERL